MGTCRCGYKRLLTLHARLATPHQKPPNSKFIQPLMPPRIAPKKRPLERPEYPRPTKRVATALASSSTSVQSTGNIDPDNSIVSKLSQVDIAVSLYMETMDLDRDQFNKFKPVRKTKTLGDIFQLIVGNHESVAKLDPNLQEMIHPTNFSDQWQAFTESHPDLIDILLECWSLDPPSFNKILELGMFIVKFEDQSPIQMSCFILEYLQKPKPQPGTSKNYVADMAEYEGSCNTFPLLVQ